jgi:hypothetical protein
MVADLEDDEVVLVARGDGAHAAGGWGEGRDGQRDRRSMAAEAGYGGNCEQRGAPPPTPGTCYSVCTEYTVWRSYQCHTLLVMRAQ